MKMKSIFYFVVLGLCVNVIPAKAQVNVQDSLALVDLYNSTDGPHWKNQTNWLTSSPLEKWHGITVTNERVAQISLRYNNLAGNIPSTIGNLVNLTDFRLDHNELKGAIPSSFGNLVNLTILELGDNQLSGNIPASLGNLVNLLSFHLNNNQLSGSIPSSI